MTINNIYTANLYGPFYSKTKIKSVTCHLTAENSTIEELINKLLEQFPEIWDFIYEGTELAENTMIVLNGDIIGGDNWKDTFILPNDRISFFQGQHGG